MGTHQSNNANYLCNLCLSVIAQVNDRFRPELETPLDFEYNNGKYIRYDLWQENLEFPTPV